MRNYFVYEPALKIGSLEELEKGIINLNSLFVNRDDKRDNFFCNSSIWECDTTQGRIYEMFSAIVNPELQRLIPVLFGSITIRDIAYTNHIQFDEDFPNDCNGFTGFQFDHTNINADRRVFNKKSYEQFVEACLKYGVIQNEIKMKESLSLLYPKLIYSARSIEETLNWKNSNSGLYSRLLELFEDIPLNPFKGGIGETEVLKHMSGVASKRINQAHRVTYKLEKNTITILACSGHYD